MGLLERCVIGCGRLTANVPTETIGDHCRCGKAGKKSSKEGWQGVEFMMRKALRMMEGMHYTIEPIYMTIYFIEGGKHCNGNRMKDNLYGCFDMCSDTASSDVNRRN